MFWFLYLIFTLLASHIIAAGYRQLYSSIFIFILVLFITPSHIELSGNNFAPSIFTFFFNILLERDISLRVLRPLVITLPLAFLLKFILSFTKKKLFL